MSTSADSIYKNLPVSLTWFDDSEIQLIKKIGEGQQGSVWHGRIGSSDVAVKRLPKDFDKEAWENLENEIQILCHLHHPNITLFQGASLNPSTLSIISELCVSDLEKYLPTVESLINRLEIARGICKGMSWLHECGIVHLDLKPANILVTSQGTPKITDFGYSRVLRRNKLTSKFKNNLSQGGTPWYTSPERWRDLIFSDTSPKDEDEKPSDVYSFAIILWQIITFSKDPFPQMGEDFMAFGKLIINGHRPDLRNIESHKLRLFLDKLWESTPSDRLSFPDAHDKLSSIILSTCVPDQQDQDFWKEACNQFADDNDLKVSIPSVKFMEAIRELIKQHLISLKHSSIQFDPNFLSEKVDPKCFIPEIKEEADILRGSNRALLKYLQKANEKQSILIEHELTKREWLGKMHTLEKLIVEKDQVELERFGRVITALHCHVQDFSPFGLIETVYHLCQQTWFYPHITSEKAKQILIAAQQGQQTEKRPFIVRLRQNLPELALTYLQGGQKQCQTLFKYHPTTEMWEYSSLCRPTLIMLMEDIVQHNSITPLVRGSSDQYFDPESFWEVPEGQNYFDMTYSSHLAHQPTVLYDSLRKTHRAVTGLDLKVEKIRKLVGNSSLDNVRMRIKSLERLRADLIRNLITRHTDKSSFMHTLGEYTIEIELLNYFLQEKSLKLGLLESTSPSNGSPHTSPYNSTSPNSRSTPSPKPSSSKPPSPPASGSSKGTRIETQISPVPSPRKPSGKDSPTPPRRGSISKEQPPKLESVDSPQSSKRTPISFLFPKKKN